MALLPPSAAAAAAAATSAARRAEGLVVLGRVGDRFARSISL